MSTVHGEARKTPEYRTWSGIRARCLCKTSGNRDFSRYCGAGITVCERWNSYANFLADMGRKPSASHSIDRIDNSKGYSPENCRWATRKEQIKNRTNTIFLTLNGVTKSAAEWEADTGIPITRIRGRIRLGWTSERILLTPERQKRTKRL